MSSDYDGESIMASIAALKEILNIGGGIGSSASGGGTGVTAAANNIQEDEPSYHHWEDQINELKQKRYEDVRSLQVQMGDTDDELRRLKSDLQEATTEAQRERALRVSLESTNDAMNEHKKQLDQQLELMTKTKSELENEITTLRSQQATQKENHVKEKDDLNSTIEKGKTEHQKTLQEVGEWEAKFLTSQREVEELKVTLSKMEQQQQQTKSQDRSVVPPVVAATTAGKSTKQFTELKRRHQQDVEELKAKHKQELENVQNQLTESKKGHKEALEKVLTLTRETTTAAVPPPATATAATGDSSSGNKELQKALAEAKDLKKQVLLAKKSQLETTKKFTALKKQHKETSDKLAELEEQNMGAVEELELAKEELKKSEKALKGTQDKVDELKKRLDYAEREISQEEIEEEQEREEALTKKHTSLRDSLIKVSKKVGEMQAKIAESGESPASKKSKLLVETSKRGALLESQQDVLKDKLKTAKAKADKVREKYISVRGVWNAANERVTEAQAEYDKCVSEIEQLQKEYEDIQNSDMPQTGKRRSSQGGDVVQNKKSKK